MRRYSPAGGTVILENSTAYAVCDGLLRMANSVIIQLPEQELRDIRFTLDTLLTRTDQVLDLMEGDVYLNFDHLKIDPFPSYPHGTEDFGAVLVSTTVTTDIGASPSPPQRCTVNCGPVLPRSSSPRETPAPAATPVRAVSPTLEFEIDSASVTKVYDRYPLVLSSRENVGFPDYSYHPRFVQAGIPGAYRSPPVVSGSAADRSYYVVIKGLYVGIFLDWEEVEPWVLGVAGSQYKQVETWDEARDIYNSRLGCGAVKILS